MTKDIDYWRSLCKQREDDWLILKDQYSELARALGFEGDAWFGDPLASHGEILIRAEEAYGEWLLEYGLK